MHLTDIWTFLGEQTNYFEEMKGCINGAYLLSVEARKSYRSLAEETIKVLNEYEVTKQRSESMVVISIVIGIAASAFSAATIGFGSVVLGGVASAAFGTAATELVSRQEVSGSDPVEILESYFEVLEKTIEHNLNEEALTLTRNFQSVTARVYYGGSNISSPLPTVDSYVDFESPFRPSGGEFDARVQEQLGQLANAAGSTEGTHSDIQRALDGE